MDIKHIWSVICKESVINQDDNVISLIGVIEELTLSLVPKKEDLDKLPEKINVPLSYEIVSYWMRESLRAQQIDIKVTITSPDGEILLNNEHGAIFPDNTKRLRSRLKIQGFVIKKTGEYTLKVYLKNKTGSYDQVSQLPIQVKLNKEKILPRS